MVLHAEIERGRGQGESAGHVPTKVRQIHCFGFFGIGRAGTPATCSPGGTSRVTTDPAPVFAPAPIFTGATSDEFEPMNAPSPISVACLTAPSQLQVMV